MFIYGPAFAVVEDAGTSGTWSVDGSTPEPFATTAGSANTITIDLPDKAGAVRVLTTGKTLTVISNGKTVRASLEGTAQAFKALIACVGQIEAR